MPAQQGLGLDDQQGLAPGPKATGQQHQECPFGRGAARALGAAPEDEELLTQESILGDEGGPIAHEVGEGAGYHALCGRLRRRAQAVPERGQGIDRTGRNDGTGASASGASSANTDGDRATPRGVARPSVSLPRVRSKWVLHSNGYSKRPTQPTRRRTWRSRRYGIRSACCSDEHPGRSVFHPGRS